MGDWDREQIKPASDFVRLKSKGELIKFRIAGSVLRELQIWPADEEAGRKPIPSDQTKDFTPGQWLNIMSNPEWKISEVFYLQVIDREDGRAKLFAVTGGTYGKIRDYATDPDWGDPRGYDITVTRTEEAGNYYAVKPSPNKTSLMQSELDAVAKLDVKKLVPGARPNSDKQPEDEINLAIREPLPWEPQPTTRLDPAKNSMLDINKPVTQPEDLVSHPEESTEPAGNDPVYPVDDTPVNLDDIPF